MAFPPPRSCLLSDSRRSFFQAGAQRPCDNAADATRKTLSTASTGNGGAVGCVARALTRWCREAGCVLTLGWNHGKNNDLRLPRWCRPAYPWNQEQRSCWLAKFNALESSELSIFSYLPRNYWLHSSRGEPWPL